MCKCVVHVCVYLHVNVYVCVYKYVNVWCVCEYLCASVCVSVCACVCICVHVCQLPWSEKCPNKTLCSVEWLDKEPLPIKDNKCLSIDPITHSPLGSNARGSAILPLCWAPEPQS